MGLKTYFIRLKSCCQSSTDNYFDKKLYKKSEKRVSTEDFLKKRFEDEDNIEIDCEFSESSILIDEKIDEQRHIEIDETSILSDENINQLRRRNPRLNRFNTDVIRLSLRKSLYANNLEKDLEKFLIEQQKEANKNDNKVSPYTISDMRELYDLINTISVKGGNNDTKEEKKEKNHEKKDDIMKSNIDFNETNKDLETFIGNEISAITNKEEKSPIIINTLNLDISKYDKEVITKEDNKSQKNENENENKHKNNSIDLSLKDTNIKESKNVLCNSPEQKISEALTPLQPIGDKNINSDYIQNFSSLNRNEKTCSDSNEISKNLKNLSPKQINFEKITDDNGIKSTNNFLCSSPEQDFTEKITDDNGIKSTNNFLCSSPEQNFTEKITDDNEIKSTHNYICSSPEENYDELSEISEKEINNNNDNILFNSPEQNYKDISLQLTKDEDNTNKNQEILTSSPQCTSNAKICYSPEDKEDNKNKKIFTSSPLLISSPQLNTNHLICQSPEDEINIKNQEILTSSPQTISNDIVYHSPENVIDNKEKNILTSIPSKETDNYNNVKNDIIFHHSNTEKRPKAPKLGINFHKTNTNIEIKPTGNSLDDYGNSFNSYETLMMANQIKNKNQENHSISPREKNHLFSQLKMSELSTKTNNNNNNSLLFNSILGSMNNYNSNDKNSLNSKPSSINTESIYSYDSMELSSRKITKRGLKIIKSKDTLTNVKPINLKTRDRKALLIGINYLNKPYQLNGCINDAKYILSFLKQNYDFKDENCKVMTDDSEDETLIPTKENIIKNMKWLVKDAKPGDSLFFHYSGHGLSIKDENGDEIDGMDESILPIDYEENGVILDDEIHDLIVKPLPKNCLLTALADCCHSGTVLDLPFIYKCNGEIESVKEMDEEDNKTKQEYLSNEIYKKNKMVYDLVYRNSSPTKVNLSLEERIKIDEKIKKDKYSEADVIQFSSCRDNEISADERANGNTYGALCNAFVSTVVSTILEEKTISYLDLLIEIRNIIKKKYGQTPQLSTCRPMDVNKPFEL